MSDAVPTIDGVRVALAQALAQEPLVRVALVFGSVARGRATAGSDVDLAVEAPGCDLFALGARLERAIGRDVDVVSLDDASVPLLSAIVRQGVLVYEGRRGAAAAWRAHALTSLETEGPWWEAMRDAWIARVAGHGLTHGRP